MKVYIDDETGLLILDDVYAEGKDKSDGCRILSSSSCDDFFDEVDELENALERSDAKNELLKEQLAEERNKNEKLIFNIGVLYDRLETIKRAHYLEGYVDGAWELKHQNVNKNYEQLKSDVATFPALLDSALCELKDIIDKK